MRKGNLNRRIYHMAYDKPILNNKALQIKKSLDEVKKLLNPVTRKSNQ